MVVLRNFPAPTDGIKHQQAGTVAHINSSEMGKGTLFITESCLSWVNSATGQGFALEYPHISLHAVSRDLQSFPQECLYIMLDVPIQADAQNQVEAAMQNQCGDNEEVDDSDSEAVTEMRFVPDDKGMLDAMYHAMCECQSLHPDPAENPNEDEDDDFGDAEEEEEATYNIPGDVPIIINNSSQGATNGQHQQHNEPMEIDVGQFEDADCDPDN